MLVAPTVVKSRLLVQSPIQVKFKKACRKVIRQGCQALINLKEVLLDKSRNPVFVQEALLRTTRQNFLELYLMHVGILVCHCVAALGGMLLAKDATV